MMDLREQLQHELGSAYTLEKELGGGGMSRVFLAKDNALGRQVVIKILPPEMAAAVSSQRFRREVQLAANLQHPHIVPLLSAGEINGLPYFTMPYVKGESLRAHLAKVGELPLSEAIRILREVSSALAYAHDNNVVHRDIKPDNVLISGDSAVVTDFGVAKALTASSEETGSSLTSMGVALGTPAYMAPEQATADPHTDHRADIYALGVMAYEMITGSTPFANRTPQATLAAHVTEAPESITRKRSNTPPGLAAIVMRCLEKRAADRPQSAREIVNQLDALTTPSGGMTPTASYRAPKRRKISAPIGGAIAIAVLAIGVLGYRSYSGRATDSAPEIANQRSIAVLPFKNMSGDPSNEYLGDGVADELVNVLGQIQGLRVAARASSFQFKGKDADVREIGSKLGVETVLDGSLRKSGDKVRITAQLIDAKNGYQLWSETFERQMDDVFAVQDEITSQIGRALQIQFGAAQLAKLKNGRPADPAAYELYLKGSFAERTPSPNRIETALNYYKQAAEKDSSYTMAWTAIANSYLNLAALGRMSAAEGNANAEKALKRALAQNPDIAQVRASYATFLIAKGDYAGAATQYRSAIEKNPNNAGVHMGYAHLLMIGGDVDGAIRESQLAQTLNPLAISVDQSVAVYLLMATRYKEAIERFRKVLQARPGDELATVNLAQALAEDGQYAEAIAQADKSLSASPDDPWTRLMRAYVYAKAGRKDEAMKVVKAEEVKPDAINFVAEIASVYGVLGDKDKAFSWLDKLTTVQGTYLKLDPMLGSLHGDPRFPKLLEKWKLN